MNIGVCTLAIGDEFKRGSEYCVESIRRYCKQHSYTFIDDESLVDYEREFYWSKVLLLCSQLKNFDYIVWIDADIMIMNPEFKLETLIVQYLGSRDMLLAIDHGDMINTGFWIIRNCTWSFDMLDLIYNIPELCALHHEQGVLNALYERNMLGAKDRCVIIPEVEGRLCNASMSSYHLGDFLIHFLGIRNPKILQSVTYNYTPYAHKGETEVQRTKRLTNTLKQFHSPNMRYIKSTPKVRVAMCSIYAGDKYNSDATKYGKRALQRYCRVHGYDLYIETEPLITDLPPHFSKMPLIHRYLDKGYDYVVWMDADVMIMNNNFSLTKLVQDNLGTRDMMLCRDISGHINTGVWIVKNTEYSKKVLESVTSLPELRYRNCEEQDVFNRMYERDIYNLQQHCTIFQDQTVMNCCVGMYRWGVFLIHFMSLSKEGLRNSFNQFYPDRRDDETQIEFQNRLLYIYNFNR